MYVISLDLQSRCYEYFCLP